MKLFQIVQKDLAFVGVSSTEKPFNQKNLMVFVLYAVNVVLYCILLYRDTVSFRECIDVIYVISVTVDVIACFIVIVSKTKSLFQCIELMEGIVNSSESTVHFDRNSLRILSKLKNNLLSIKIHLNQNYSLLTLFYSIKH